MPSMPWVGVWTTVTSRAVSCAATQARSSSGEPTSRWLWIRSVDVIAAPCERAVDRLAVAVLEDQREVAGHRVVQLHRVCRQRCGHGRCNRELLVVDDDQLGRVARLQRRRRDDHRDRLADEPDPVARQHRHRRRPMRLAVGPLERAAGRQRLEAGRLDVGRGEDRDDAVGAGRRRRRRSTGCGHARGRSGPSPHATARAGRRRR